MVLFYSCFQLLFLDVIEIVSQTNCFSCDDEDIDDRNHATYIEITYVYIPAVSKHFAHFLL